MDHYLLLVGSLILKNAVGKPPILLLIGPLKGLQTANLNGPLTQYGSHLLGSPCQCSVTQFHIDLIDMQYWVTITSKFLLLLVKLKDTIVVFMGK